MLFLYRGLERETHFPQRVDWAHGLFTQENEGAVAELSKVLKQNLVCNIPVADKYLTLFYPFYGILTLFLVYSDQSGKRVRNPPLMPGIWNQLHSNSTQLLTYFSYKLFGKDSYYWHPGLLILIRSHSGPCYLRQHSSYSINSLCFGITLKFTNYLLQWFQAVVHFQGGSNTSNSSVAKIFIVAKAVEENIPVSVQEVKLYYM